MKDDSIAYVHSELCPWSQFKCLLCQLSQRIGFLLKCSSRTLFCFTKSCS